MSFKENKVNQEGHPKEAGLALRAGSRRKDNCKGVGRRATLLLQSSPNLADLWSVGILILPSEDFFTLWIVEVEGHVDQTLATAAVASHTSTAAAGFRLDQVQDFIVLVVGELGHTKAHVTVVARL